MARRRKKKNSFKSFIDLIILIILLVIIIFLVQKFIIPFILERGVPEMEEKKEEIELIPPSDLEEEQVVLYFADENAQYLIPEYRIIREGAEGPAKQAIIELIKGPANSELYPTMPSTTRVNNLYVSDGIAYIDLSSEIINRHPGGSAGELLTVYSIVMTLTSFQDINKVQILVDGNSEETLVGHVDTSMPLERDEGWLRK